MPPWVMTHPLTKYYYTYLLVCDLGKFLSLSASVPSDVNPEPVAPILQDCCEDRMR